MKYSFLLSVFTVIILGIILSLLNDSPLMAGIIMILGSLTMAGYRYVVNYERRLLGKPNELD